MAYTAKPSKIPTWATSTGSNILTGLTATAAQWQSNITISGVQYGIIRYTFSGSPDLSTVIAGHKLNVTTGFTNTENKVSGAEIYAVNNASDYIDALSLERISNSLDETGVSATSTTVTGDGARIVEPSGSKKAAGYRSPEKPSDGVLNWLLYYIGAWIAMLDANYPTGFLLQGRLTAGEGVSITDNGDNTYLIAGDGIISTGSITQASHGFAALDVIRHNDTTWVDAQANSIAGCTDVWIVTSAPTVNTFVAVKSGRVTVTTHGLTPGSTYYLSADTAALLTTTKPVGNVTRPLGYYLPCVYVESANVLHILGEGLPTFNPVYAEYVATGNVDLDTIAFASVSLNNVGNTLKINLVGEETDTNVATARVTFTGVTTYYSFERIDDGAAMTRSTSSSAYFKMGATGGEISDDDVTCNAILMRGSNSAWSFYGRSIRSAVSADPGVGIPVYSEVTGRCYTGANITAVSFSSSSANFRLSAGDYVHLLIDRMPTA